MSDAESNAAIVVRLRLGRSVGFLEAELLHNDTLIATSSSTVRLIHLDAKK